MRFQLLMILIVVQALGAGIMCRGRVSASPLPTATIPIKNVVLVIGDGMGPQQVFQAIYSRRYLRPRGPELEFEKLFRDASHALVTTNSFNSVVTDSAAAATAMACGIKTRNAMVGTDSDGRPCRSILDIARASGRKVGLISTMRPGHATPAAFIAHNISRYNETAISEQIVKEAKADLILSGGARYFLPGNKKLSNRPECKGLAPVLDGRGKRKDGRDLIAEATGKGYRFICGKHDLKPEPGDKKILGLFAGNTFPHIQTRERIKNLPSLGDLTKFALDRLSRNSPRGFFLMVEGGLIDYAGHANDAGTMLQETLDLDRTIGVVREFMDDNPGTLLIVTADHETGGYSMSYRRAGKAIVVEKLPGGARYQAPYLSPEKKVFRDYMRQKASFGSMLGPILKKLYPRKGDYRAGDAYSLDRAARDLSRAVRRRTAYRLSVPQARAVLKYESPTTRHDKIQYPGLFTTNSEFTYFSNKLGRVLADRNFGVFASGNHSHTPVDAFFLVSGGSPGKVSGLLDNTDIFRIMENALK